MSSAKDSYLQQIRLLSVLDLEELSGVVATIVTERTGAKAVGVVIYDRDMDALSNRYWHGDGRKDLSVVGETFCEEFKASSEQTTEINFDALDVSLPGAMLPVYCYQIRMGQELCGCLLISAPNVDADEITHLLSDLPLPCALNNAWEHSELCRENERLRSNYDEIEKMTKMLETQTQQLIHDVTFRDSIRTNQVERERLVYWISNFVRSSVDLQKVLDTTVEKIGEAFSVSRCIVLRSIDSIDQLDVSEFVAQDVTPVKELFFSEAGFEFAHQALSKTAPQDIGDPDTDSRITYDRSFLKRLGIRSGLMVPLIMRERVLGALFLQDCAEPRDWSIDDISLIGSLADNLSVAIENADLHQEIARQAVTDGLTGVANRRSFNESFSREFERARRYNEPLSLVMIDLDFLKKINDTYGHKAGDDAIASIGKLLKLSSRVSDVAARYGGEEFCLLLPNTEVEMAEQLAERIRRMIYEVHIEGPGTISASLGVASYPHHADDCDQLFQKADAALYAAKQSGRNRVHVANKDDTTRLTEFADDKGIAADVDSTKKNTPEAKGNGHGEPESKSKLPPEKKTSTRKLVDTH
jgi:diguanylate cyclase (GGDEF)-like protein